MNNPFSLKKQVVTSPYKKATMIVSKDLGKGTSKKFYLDTNACNALNITNESELAFITHKNFIILADVTHLNKNQWGLSKTDYNKVNNAYENLEINGLKYKFRSFSNSVLLNVLEEEFEFDRTKYTILNIDTIPQDVLHEIFDEQDLEVFERMEINILYILTIDHILEDLNFKIMLQPRRATINRITETMPSNYDATKFDITELKEAFDNLSSLQTTSDTAYIKPIDSFNVEISNNLEL